MSATSTVLACEQSDIPAASHSSNEYDTGAPSPPNASLHRLPTEILLQIGFHLTGCSRSAYWFLSRTCQRFHLLFTDAVNPARIPVYDDANLEIDRHIYLSILERTGCTGRNMTCSKCVDLHHFTKFSQDQQQATALERVCLAAQGRPWVCPHKAWTIEELHRERGADRQCIHARIPFRYPPCACLRYPVHHDHTLFLHAEAPKVHGLRKTIKAVLGLRRAKNDEHLRFRKPGRPCDRHDGCAKVKLDTELSRCRICMDAEAPRESKSVWRIIPFTKAKGGRA